MVQATFGLRAGSFPMAMRAVRLALLAAFILTTSIIQAVLSFAATIIDALGACFAVTSTAE